MFVGAHTRTTSEIHITCAPVRANGKSGACMCTYMGSHRPLLYEKTNFEQNRQIFQAKGGWSRKVYTPPLN